MIPLFARHIERATVSDRDRERYSPPTMKTINLAFALLALFAVGCSSGSGSATPNTEAPAPKTSDAKSETVAAAKSADPKKDISEDELGVPFYPGSEIDTKGSNFKNVTDAVKNYETARTTSDTPKQVADFYMGKVKNAKSMGGGDTMMVDGKLDSGAIFSLVASKKDGKTAVKVSTILKK